MSRLGTALLFLLLTFSLVNAQSQPAAAPVSQKELIAWLIGGKADSRIQKELKSRGIGFTATPEVISWLKSVKAIAVIDVLPTLKHSDSIIGFDPDKNAQAFKRALEMKQDENLESAFNLLKTTGDQSFEAHFALAGILKQAEIWQGAKKEYTDAVTLYPKSIDALLGLSYADYRLGLGATAQKAAESAVALDPNDSDSHKFLGLAFLASKDNMSAAREFRRAIELNPRNAAAYFDLGIAESEAGNKAAAIAAYRRAAELDATKSDYSYNLGIELSDSGDRSSAIEAYKRAKAINPDDLRIRNNLVVCYCESGRYQETIAEANELLKMDPDWNMIRPSLAKAQYAINDIEGAIKSNEEYLRREPGDSQVISVLVDYYLQQKRFADAQQLVERKLANTEAESGKQSEPYADALGELAMVHQYKGEWSVAEPLIAQTLAIYGKDPALKFSKYVHALNYHAGTLRQLGREADAKGEENKAAEIEKMKIATTDSAQERWDSLRNAAMRNIQNPGMALEFAVHAYQAAKLVKDDGKAALESGGMLAWIYGRLQQQDQARQTATDLLQFEEKSHPQSTAVAKALLMMEGTLDRSDASKRPVRIQMLERSSAIASKSDEKPLELAVAGQLAQVYIEDGQRDKALPILKNALVRSEQLNGADNINVVPQVDQLGAFYLSSQQWALAEPLYKRSLALYEKQWGPQHPPLTGILWQLTRIEEALGKTSDANAYKTRAEKMAENLRANPGGSK